MSEQWPVRVALSALVASTLALSAPAQAQEPTINTLTIGPMDTATLPFQTNVYTISAKAGPLQLKAAALPPDAFVDAGTATTRRSP